MYGSVNDSLQDLLQQRAGVQIRGSTGGSVGCNGWNESMADSSSSSSCFLCFLRLRFR